MIIHDYTDDWNKSFILIRGELEKSLRSYKRIEHIGSTSIPGMKAKPVIDIDIEIDDVKCFSLLKNELEFIGYRYCGNQGIDDREVFKRVEISNNNNILDRIKHHLYVCPSSSKEYFRHIQFRDYLRKNPEYVQKYNKIKEEILLRYGKENRQKYVEIKELEYKWFFDEVLDLCTKR